MNKRIPAIIACTILLQCLVVLYWQNQRGNFYIDELHSFEYASSYTSDSTGYVLDDPAWKWAQWMDAKNLTEQLRVDSTEQLSDWPVGEQLKRLLTKRAFMGLLNYIMTDTGHDASFFTYARNAALFNLWFLFIAELMLAYCVKTLTHSDIMMTLSFIMFGMSSIMIGMTEYLRFYILTVALMMVVVCCHLKIWKEKSLLWCLCMELIAFVSAYIGLYHSELMLVTCGCFFCFFFAGLLLRKRFAEAIIYAVPLLYGMYHYVYRRTNLLRVVIHPADFAYTGTHGIATTAYSFLTVTPERAWGCIKVILKIFGEKWFGSIAVMLMFTALLTLCAIYSILWRNPDNSEKPEKDATKGFAIIVLLTALMSLTFNVLTDLYLDRYNCFSIALLMIVFWICVDRAQRVFDRKMFLTVVTALVLMGAVAGQRADAYQFLYMQDYPARDFAEEYCNTDSILLTSAFNESYDCIVHSGSNARIYVIDSGQTPDLNTVPELPEKFLIWCDKTRGDERLKQALVGTDYSVTSVGSTYTCDVYLCSKK